MAGRFPSPRKNSPGRLLVLFAFRQLRSILSDRNRVNRELFLVAMEGELEAIRQQLLNHGLPLFVVGLPFPVGLRGQIELLRLHPGRRAGDLLGVNPVSESDQIGQRRIDRRKLAAPDHKSLAGTVRRGGLDRGHFKLRIRIRRHRFRRRRRFRNRPRGLRRRTLQVQRQRLGSLLPVPRDRISVGLQLSPRRCRQFPASTSSPSCLAASPG